jgi:DNA-binding IclR family transcriptional regulator
VTALQSDLDRRALPEAIALEAKAVTLPDPEHRRFTLGIAIACLATVASHKGPLAPIARDRLARLGAKVREEQT